MITVISGPRGSGKTTIALGLANALHGFRSEYACLIFDELSQDPYEESSYKVYPVTSPMGIKYAWGKGKKAVTWDMIGEYVNSGCNVFITCQELYPELEKIANFIIHTHKS